jgi:hypothetical protein
MVTLISDIKALVEQSSSAEEAALLIVVYQEEEGLSLDGNGWLEDDPLYEKFGNKYRSLRSKAEKILEA